jgi:hypothetical protein
MTRKASTVQTLEKPVRPEQEAQPGALRMPLGELARAATDEIGLTTPDNAANRPALSDEAMYRLIQESAYYKAKARGFWPGCEEQDWLEAEAEINARLGLDRPERN